MVIFGCKGMAGLGQPPKLVSLALAILLFCQNGEAWEAQDERLRQVVGANLRVYPPNEVYPQNAFATQPDANKRHFLEMVLIGEAADQGLDGLYAVACVLRTRGYNHEGFSASRRRNLRRFVDAQPPKVKLWATEALEKVLHGDPDTTGGATHYESDKFPEPAWARRMIKTVKIKNHQFWKEK